MRILPQRAGYLMIAMVSALLAHITGTFAWGIAHELRVGLSFAKPSCNGTGFGI